MLFEFRAYLTKPHDGDSFWVMCDQGYDGRAEPELRLYDVSTPELSQVGGQECTDHINSWFLTAVTSQPDRRWPLWVESIKTTRLIEPKQKMTITRYLANVWRYVDKPDGPTPGPSLNDYMRDYMTQHPEWPTGM